MTNELQTPSEEPNQNKKRLADSGKELLTRFKDFWKPVPAPSDGHHYHARLLAVYQDLRKKQREAPEKTFLLAELPAWTSKFNLDPTNPNASETLRQNPRLQEAVAAVTAYTPSKWLLERELSERDANNVVANKDEDNSPVAEPGPAGTESEEPPKRKSWPLSENEDVYDAAAREELSGLCFSGGGIRSATFCLGVLQALAECGQLHKFDYLSTVSGGGYIHQWLASWIHNDHGGIGSVERKLSPVPSDESLARSPDQIRWLRRYSSYLTPQRGILSADTWTMIAIWFRNTFLNQIVLFGFLASCLLAIRGFTYPFVMPPVCPRDLLTCTSWIVFVFMVIVLLFVVAATTIRFGSALASLTKSVTEDTQEVTGALGNKGVLGWVILPGFVLAILMILEAYNKIPIANICGKPFHIVYLAWVLYVGGMVLAVTFGGCAPQDYLDVKPIARWGSPRTRQLVFIVLVGIAALGCAALAGSWSWYLAENNGVIDLSSATRKTTSIVNGYLNRSAPRLKLHGDISSDGKSIGTVDFLMPGTARNDRLESPIHSDFLLATFAPVVIFFLQFLAIRLQLGILGRFYAESRREWLARLGGWSAIISCGWIALCAIACLGPGICRWFFSATVLRGAWGIFLVLATHAITLYSGASGKTDGKPKPGTLFGYAPLDIVGMLGAPICIVSLLVIAAGLIDVALGRAWQLSHWGPIILFSTVLLLFLFFGWRVDVNEFSLHGFYRNRLSRCYLGGNNPMRTPDPFTGFDDHTETGTAGIRLSDLRPEKFGAVTKDARNPYSYDGPFPIFCSTVNLTFGEDLAWQERKGASFAFTPLYSGYHVGWTAATRRSDDNTTFNGFVLTKEYAYPDGGVSLATVTAISGAALSPNQGYSSQPALAFLMTLFNVRLGWWIANPRRPKVWPSFRNEPTPAFGLRYLLSELFGLASDTSDYVCLCDGGRFENMGLYELVRRRCSHIVICDAEDDEHTVFEGIGNAVAKCRSDFGVEISLDLCPLIPDPVTGLASAHFVVGSIRYPAPPGADGADPRYTGEVIYLKTSIVGDETADLLHHKRAFPEFPQDSTLNQWFNESQFESYRRLGQLIAEQVCDSLSG
jgi:hypothetical protein